MAPTSTVAAMPASTTAPGSFTVNWTGSDNAGGSGIVSYNVYVSDNGGTYTAWLTNTTANSATFSGKDGHTYKLLQHRHRQRRQCARDAAGRSGDHQAAPSA